jgi:hypothetical protein
VPWWAAAGNRRKPVPILPKAARLAIGVIRCLRQIKRRHALPDCRSGPAVSYPPCAWASRCDPHSYSPRGDPLRLIRPDCLWHLAISTGRHNTQRSNYGTDTGYLNSPLFRDSTDALMLRQRGSRRFRRSATAVLLHPACPVLPGRDVCQILKFSRLAAAAGNRLNSRCGLRPSSLPQPCVPPS